MTTEETIKAFLTKMSTQNNRGTAFPIFYVIRSSVKCASYPGNGEEHYYNEDYVEITEKEKDAAEERGETVNKMDEEMRWEEHGMFLTETDAEQNLKDNGHHYSKDAHTYVKHAYRAPELKAFLLALFEHFGIEPREDKETM